MIKLFALDMDGTLLDSKSRLREETIDALKDLQASGVRVLLCSGRVFSSVYHYAREIDDKPCLIANNGAVMGLSYKKLFYQEAISYEDLEKLYEISLAYDLDFHFYDLDTYYSNKFDPDRVRHLLVDPDDIDNYTVKFSISDNPIKELKDRKHMAYKFQINNLDTNPLAKERLEKILVDEFSDKLSFTSSFDRVLEIMAGGVTKAETLEGLLDKMGLCRNNLAAIGDGLNDLEMLKISKLSFAMANGKDELKDIADYIVSDNDSGGILEACKLIKEYNHV